LGENIKAKTWRFVSEDGTEYPFAYVNGYEFGGLLEGLYFKITIVADGKFKAEARPQDMEYLAKKFNIKRYLKEAEEFASSNDIFSDESGAKEIWVVDGQGNMHPQLAKRLVPKPIVVGMSSITDILGGLK
jgi:hypothetical protein